MIVSGQQRAISNPYRDSHPRDDEAELSYLNHEEAGSQGGARQIAKSVCQDRGEHHLGNDCSGDEQDDFPNVIYQKLRIGQHPQRNEEEGGKDIPHRDDLGERPLSRPIRLAQDESGEERAKSGGEPCPFGKRGSGESCCNDRDDE